MGKKNCIWIGSLLLLFLCWFPQQVFAQPDDPLEQMRKKLEKVLKRQDRIESENKQLQVQVEDLSRQLDQAREDPELIEQQAEYRQQLIEDVLAEAELVNEEPIAGYHPGGGGYYIKGENYQFRLLGYVQTVGSIFDGSLDRDDGNGDFSVRRARIDFLADFYEDFQLLVEFDGGPGTTPTASSDFALVEARMNWKILNDALQLRLGKFTTPFSTENFRTSRVIDTVERFVALNSMFLLPGLDVQYGAMLHGKVAAPWNEKPRLEYFLGVFNGNGRANDNFSDNNTSKEIQARLNYNFTDTLTAGVAFDFSREEEQALSLADLGFNRYVSVPVEDQRYGFDTDMFWHSGPWSFRAEGLAFWFESPHQDDAGLYGGFIQPAYFVAGDADRGVQLLLRSEFAHLDADTGDNGDTLYSITAGVNWFVNPNVRIQINAIMTYFDGPSAIQDFDDDRWLPMMLTEVQFKF